MATETRTGPRRRSAEPPLEPPVGEAGSRVSGGAVVRVVVGGGPKANSWVFVFHHVWRQPLASAQTERSVRRRHPVHQDLELAVVLISQGGVWVAYQVLDGHRSPCSAGRGGWRRSQLPVGDARLGQRILRPLTVMRR